MIYRAAQNLSFNVNDLEKAKLKIEGFKNDLDSLKKDLSTSLDNLKEGWQTDTGKEFFTNDVEGWEDCVEKYGAKIDGLSEMLGIAIDEYKKIEDEIAQLKF